MVHRATAFILNIFTLHDENIGEPLNTRNLQTPSIYGSQRHRLVSAMHIGNITLFSFMEVQMQTRSLIRCLHPFHLAPLPTLICIHNFEAASPHCGMRSTCFHSQNTTPPTSPSSLSSEQLIRQTYIYIYIASDFTRLSI